MAEFKLGDRVKIKEYDGGFGRISELRGGLGPGGAPVYRVLLGLKPRSYIEVLGEQLELAPTPERPAPVEPSLSKGV